MLKNMAAAFMVCGVLGGIRSKVSWWLNNGDGGKVKMMSKIEDEVFSKLIYLKMFATNYGSQSGHR
ncbi:hypothetical protein HanIR_Chr09g0407271 [Helianthus annuus]|nr:hypothetical protein HanIR_Chr09g0407271 [Helianthus annuus]